MELKGLKIILDLDISNLNDKIVDTKKQFNNLQKELNNIGKALQFNPKSMDLLNTKSASLKEQQQRLLDLLELYEDELAKLNGEGFDKTDRRVRVLTTNIEACKGKLKEINKELALIAAKKITAPIDAFADATEKAGEKLKELSNTFKVLSTTAGATLTGIAKGAVDYEDAFASVRKTVEETYDDNGKLAISYADLSDSILELSKAVPSSASEIAEVVALAGQLGIETENVITFSKSMIDLGNSTNLSASEAAESLAKFINVTGSSAGDIDKLGSALVWLGNNSATTEKDILELAYRLVGTGTSLGFTETQILGLSTALSSTGLKAEAAGGSISTVLQNIAKEVAGTDMKAANKELKVWGDLLGMSGKQFKKAWEDNAFDTFKQVIVALGNTEGSSGALITKLSELGVETIRTTDSMQRLVRVGDLLDDYVDKANKAYEEGNALQIEAAKRYETTASQLKILRNNISAIAIAIGSQVLPVINRFIERTVEIAKKVAEWGKTNGMLVVKILAIVAAISPALLILSKLFTFISSVARAISLIITKIVVWRSAIKGIISGMLGFNVGIFGWIAGIAALVASLVYAYKTNDSFRESVNTFVSTLTENLKPILATVWDIIKGVATFIAGMVQPILTTVWGIIRDDLIPVITFLTEVVMNVISGVTTLIAVWSKKLYPIISTFVGGIGLVFIAVWEGICSAVKGVIDIVKLLAEKIGGLFFTFNDTSPIKTFGDAISALTSPIKVVRDAVSGLTGWLTTAIDKIKSFLGLNSGAQNAYNDTVSKFANVSRGSAYAYQSGGFGFASGGFTSNVTINVSNNGRDITNADVRRWANVINEQLGGSF